MTLGLCMIVKNEHDVLAKCLESVAGVFDEIVVVDTGSKDDTRRIAQKYATVTANYRWNNNFAAARNYSFSLSHTDYVMWLDADDVLLPSDKTALLELKTKLDGKTDVYMLLYRAGTNEDDSASFCYYRERIVRNSKEFLWSGVVHEAITPHGKIEYTDISVTHNKPACRKATCRNLCIFAKAFADGMIPDERQKFYFARELLDNGLYDTAATVYEYFLQGDGWTENKICACRDLARCYKCSGRKSQRLRALLKSFEYAPPRPELCCDLGEYFFEEEDYAQAVFWYKLAINEKTDARTGAFVMPDYSGFIPFIWLAVCYDKLKNYEKAMYYNEQAGKIKPHDKSYLHNKLYFENLMKDRGK